MFMFVVLVLCAWQTCHVYGCDDLSKNTALIKEVILKDYVNWNMPEPLPGKHKVEILIRMGIRTIVALNALNQTLHMTAFMTEKWKDKRLTWDRLKYGNCSKITLDRRFIWKPTLELVQTVMHSKADRSFDSVIGAHIHYDGNVTYSYPAVFVTACSMDMFYFPYDRHACDLAFAPTGGEKDYVEIVLPKNENVSLKFYSLNNAWELTHIGRRLLDYGSNESNTGNSSTGTFATFTLYVRRYADVYFYFLYYPNVIFNFLGACQFLIPSNHSARKVTLGVAIIVMLFMYLILLTSTMPKSDKIPILLMFITITFGLVATSLLLAIMILTVHYKSFHFKDVEMPLWLRRIFLDKLSWILMLNFHDEDYKKVGTKKESSMESFYDSSIYNMVNARSSLKDDSTTTSFDPTTSSKGVLSYFRSRVSRFSTPSVRSTATHGTHHRMSIASSKTLASAARPPSETASRTTAAAARRSSVAMKAFSARRHSSVHPAQPVTSAVHHSHPSAATVHHSQPSAGTVHPETGERIQRQFANSQQASGKSNHVHEVHITQHSSNVDHPTPSVTVTDSAAGSKHRKHTPSDHSHENAAETAPKPVPTVPIIVHESASGSVRPAASATAHRSPSPRRMSHGNASGAQTPSHISSVYSPDLIEYRKSIQRHLHRASSVGIPHSASGRRWSMGMYHVSDSERPLSAALNRHGHGHSRTSLESGATHVSHSVQDQQQLWGRRRWSIGTRDRLASDLLALQQFQQEHERKQQQQQKEEQEEKERKERKEQEMREMQEMQELQAQSEHEEEILTLAIHHLHHISMMHKKQRNQRFISCEWQRMSAVLNRILLILYIIGTSIMWYKIYSVDRETLESEEGLQKVTIKSNFDDVAQILGAGASILG